MSSTDVNTRCRWQLPAEARVLPLVRAGISTMISRSANEEALERIRLAVTEACANVVRHAYPDGAGMLEVGICLDAERLTVDVRDTGIGVAAGRGRGPEERRGGLGLLLIDELADGVEITPSVPGTSVRMSFDLERRRRRAH